MMKYLLLASSVMSLFLFSLPVSSQVKITINSTAYNYPNTPRMADILAPVGLADNWYWPSATLFNLTSYHQLEEQRNQLIRNISIISRTDATIPPDYQAFIKQIKSWVLAKRILVNINYDHARFDINQNPQFDAGKYVLNLTRRPTTIMVFGAVSAVSHIHYVGDQCVADIISKVQPTSIADPSYVYMITPSGSIQKTPIASWNNKCVVPPPGSQILVPLQENQFFATNTDINYETALLSLNRTSTK